MTRARANMSFGLKGGRRAGQPEIARRVDTTAAGDDAANFPNSWSGRAGLELSGGQRQARRDSAVPLGARWPASICSTRPLSNLRRPIGAAELRGRDQAAASAGSRQNDDLRPPTTRSRRLTLAADRIGGSMKDRVISAARDAQPRSTTARPSEPLVGRSFVRPRPAMNFLRGSFAIMNGAPCFVVATGVSVFRSRAMRSIGAGPAEEGRRHRNSASVPSHVEAGGRFCRPLIEMVEPMGSDQPRPG